MAKEEKKVVYVKLKSKNEENCFGSISAIYDHYTSEDIGYTLRTLQTFKINEENEFENDKIRIKVFRLKQKKREQ